MANNTSVNPWILDTAGTITDDAVNIQAMHFFPSAADEDCIVKDTAGNTFWSVRSKAAASGGGQSYSVESITFNPGLGISGFVLSNIGSGKLRVYRSSAI